MKGHLTGADYLAMHVMRELDERGPKLRVDIDFEAVQNTSRQKDGAFTYPEGVLAKRAFLFLRKHTDTDWKPTLGTIWDWIVGEKTAHYVCIAAILGAVVSYAGWRTLLRVSEAGRVPVDQLVGVLAFSLVFLVFPLLGHLRIETPLALWRPLLHRHVTKLIAKATPASQGQVMPTVLDILARPITMLTVLCSHAFWIAGYLAIMVGLAFQLGFQRYDFEWVSTLFTVSNKEAILAWLPASGDSEAVAIYLTPDQVLPAHVKERYRRDDEKEVLRQLQEFPVDGIEWTARYEYPGGLGHVVDLWRLSRLPADNTRRDLLRGRFDELDEVVDLDALSRLSPEAIRRAAVPQQQDTPSTIADVRRLLSQEALEDIRWAARLAQLDELRDVLGRCVASVNEVQNALDAFSWSEEMRNMARGLQEELESTIRELGSVIRAAPPPEAGTPLPGTSQLRSANAIVQQAKTLQDVAEHEVDRSAAGRFSEESRKAVGVAMLSLLLAVCIAPRSLLAIIAALQFYCARRSLRPDPRDSYNEKLIYLLQEQGERGGEGEKTEVEDDDNMHKAGKPLDEEKGPEEDTEKHQGDDVGQRELERRDLYILSYDVTCPEKGWASTLLLQDLDSVTDLGQATNRKRREALFKQLHTSPGSSAGMILVVNYANPPGDHLRTFVRDLVAPWASRPSGSFRFVLLATGRTRALRKFRHNDVLEIERLWDRFARSIGAFSSFVQFDHEEATAEAQSPLRATWQEYWPVLFEPTQPAEERTFRYRQAFEAILKWADKAEACKEPDHMPTFTDNMLAEIDTLYRQQATAWHNRLKGAARSCGDTLSHTCDSPQQLADVVDRAKSATLSATQKGLFMLLSPFKGLPAWKRAALLGTGVVAAGGLAFPVTAPFAAATISPSFLAGVFATLGVTATAALGVLGVSRLFSRGDEPPDEPAAGATLALDDLVRSGIVRVVLLELQDAPAAEAAKQLEVILRQCDSRPIRTLAQAREACTSAETAISESHK